jgi:hypothetical protein
MLVYVTISKHFKDCGDSIKSLVTMPTPPEKYYKYRSRPGRNLIFGSPAAKARLPEKPK